MAKILIVEDNAELSTLIRIELIANKHTVEVVDNGGVALEMLLAFDFDLIVLDVELPDLDGFEICRRFRKAGKNTPVLMLTGRDDIIDKLTGLDCGADDYLTKPFDARELNARLRAMLRRAGAATSNTLTVGPLSLNLESRIVQRDGQQLKLLPKEFALLEFFMMNPGKVFSPEILLNKVWESEKAVGIGTVYTTIKTLRDKISAGGTDPLLETVHGAGYKLKSP